MKIWASKTQCKH